MSNLVFSARLHSVAIIHYNEFLPQSYTSGHVKVEIMSSREVILGRIRAALNAVPGPENLPPMPELWPDNHDSPEHHSPETLLETFESSLKVTAGELIRCSTVEEAVAKSRHLLEQINAQKVGMVARPWIQEITEKWSDIEKVLPSENPNEASPQEMAKLDAGVILAEYLLADTGSCVIASPTVFDRLMCYIPPVCFVFAKMETLRPHLQAAWPEISARMVGPNDFSANNLAANDPVGTMNRSGEFLIITGPSRTADIEKVLILGVHGPKRLIVFAVG